MNVLKPNFSIIQLLLLFFSFFFIPDSFNQELKGIVRDAETSEILIGALLNAGEAFTVTDEKGEFVFEIGEKTASINVSFIGYFDKLIPRSQIVDNYLEVLLTPQTLLLDATVVVGSKFEQRLAESSVSIERLSPKLLESTHAFNPESVLDKVPGVSIVDGQANIRGGSGYSYGAGSRVLLLIDDVPALQSDSGSPNWNDIAIENVGSIEILKGAASALYGSSALNGIINVQSAKVGPTKETKISSSYRYYGSPKNDSLRWWDRAPYEWQANIIHKQRFDKLDVVASAFVRDRSSFNKDTYNRYGRGLLNVQYRMKEDMTLRLNTNFNKGKSGSFFYWEGKEALYEGDTSTLTTTDYTRFNIDPQWIWFPSQEVKHSVKSRFYSVKNFSPRNRSNESSLTYVEYNLQKKWPVLDLVSNVGVTGTHTFSRAELYGDTSYFAQNLAIFGQFEKKLWDKLNLSAGVRYEYNRLQSPEQIYKDTLVGGVESEARPVFRFGANYELAAFTFLRASWGQGYRYPTIAEKYVATDLSTIFITPNPLLKSETGWNIEFGIRQGFKVSKVNGFVDLSLFRSEYADMMEFIFTGFIDGFQSQNTGDTRIQGIDISGGAQGKIGPVNIEMIGGFTFLDPTYQTFTFEDSLRSSANFNILKYRNKRNVKFDVEAEYQGIALGVAYSNGSHMEAIDAIFEIFITDLKDYRQRNNEGYHRFDGRLSYSWNKMEIGLQVENMFNAAYTIRPALMEAPRNFGIRYAFRF